MSFELLREPEQAARAVRRALGIGASCRSSETRFEILRAIVWSVAAPSSRVHVNRVLGAALPAWRLVSERTTASEETLRAELRDALSALYDAGDLLELNGGYWAPATARFVELPERVGYLLVAGAPSAVFPMDPEIIRYHGPFRHLAEVPPELASALPLEDLSSWARMPSDQLSLGDWARDALTSLERQPYTPTNSDAFEFYSPKSAKHGTPQWKRWSESSGGATGRLLARRRRLYGAREYRLVDARAGQIAGACDLHGIDVRRLMYALDLEAANPVRAYSRRVSGGTEWSLTTELPRAEQRVFAALGTLAIPDDRPFERRWTFARHEELARDKLRSLGIALGQQTREDPR
ncbi:MAG: hypothetical protein IT374_22920 [Polyangiaceae bacterium]|nr:hypothetical protein [Polyangiaceae bacterium]